MPDSKGCMTNAEMAAACAAGQIVGYGGKVYASDDVAAQRALTPASSLPSDGTIAANHVTNAASQVASLAQWGGAMPWLSETP